VTQIESTVRLERAVEQLRQERETFEQQKRHDARWFMLRLIMGYSSIALMFGILGTSSYVIFNGTSGNRVGRRWKVAYGKVEKAARTAARLFHFPTGSPPLEGVVRSLNERSEAVRADPWHR
jgi:hypothetical protein